LSRCYIYDIVKESANERSRWAWEDDVKKVILYSKPECHLCEPVENVILAVRKKKVFDFEVRNIENDPGDFEKYRHAIPVVLVDGKEIARYKLSRRQLEAALGSEQT
jgi:hypothetical protein